MYSYKIQQLYDTEKNNNDKNFIVYWPVHPSIIITNILWQGTSPGVAVNSKKKEEKREYYKNFYDLLHM